MITFVKCVICGIADWITGRTVRTYPDVTPVLNDIHDEVKRRFRANTLLEYTQSQFILGHAYRNHTSPEISCIRQMTVAQDNSRPKIRNSC